MKKKENGQKPKAQPQKEPKKVVEPRVVKKYSHRNDKIELSGKAKFLNKFIRFIFYPLFHPYITLFVLLIVWFAPTFFGVKPAYVHKWYMFKFQELVKKQFFMPVATNKIPKLGIQILDGPGIEKIDEKAIVSSANVNQRREMFLKPTEIDKNVFETLVEKTNDVVEVVQNKVVDVVVDEPVTMIVKKPLDLNYLNKPEPIKGKGYVLNANQISVQDKNLFLYGIYVDPASDKGKQTADFLRQYIDNKDIDCQIVAYSSQGAITAYCAVDGVNLNYLLVEKGLSNNVALGK